MSKNLDSLIAYLDSLPIASTDATQSVIGGAVNGGMGCTESCLDKPHMLSVINYMRTNPLAIEDVCSYCAFDESRYQRNLIKLTPAYELLLLCWLSGQSSPIHDHFGSRCILRVIQGTATEIRCQETGNERNGQKLVRPQFSKSYSAGDVCMSESLDIHEIINDVKYNQDLVTIHLYSPPLHMRTYAYE